MADSKLRDLSTDFAVNVIKMLCVTEKKRFLLASEKIVIMFLIMILRQKQITLWTLITTKKREHQRALVFLLLTIRILFLALRIHLIAPFGVLPMHQKIGMFFRIRKNALKEKIDDRSTWERRPFSDF